MIGKRVDSGSVQKGVWIALFFSLPLLVGCEDVTHNGPVIPIDPYQCWASLHIRDYTVDQKYMCFCQGAGNPVRITVRSDSIVSVVSLIDNMDLPKETWERFATVEQLFAQARNPEYDSVVVRYDRTFCFPDTLDINPQQHPFDGGVLFVTWNLRLK